MPCPHPLAFFHTYTEINETGTWELGKHYLIKKTQSLIKYTGGQSIPPSVPQMMTQV